MTLRDWFAGQALAALGDHNVKGDPEQITKYAYAVADAMLAERERGQ